VHDPTMGGAPRGRRLPPCSSLSVDVTTKRMHQDQNVSNTVVFLERPQISAAFAVVTTIVDASNGTLEGPELARVAKFLHLADGEPHFELAHDGTVFCKCRLTSDASRGSIAFSYNSTTPLESSASVLDP